MKLHFHHLGITSQIRCKNSPTPSPWYVNNLLYHISIGTIESLPFVSSILISSFVRVIFALSGLHISSPLYFLIGSRRIWVAYWTKPLSDFYFSTASKITYNIIPGGYDNTPLHSKTNCYSFICIQSCAGQSYRWNISFSKIRRLTNTDGDTTSGTINQGSHFTPIGYNHQCTTVFFPWKHTISFIGTDIPRWTCFPPNLSYNHPLTVWDVQVFNFIEINFSNILVTKIMFCAPSVASPVLRCKTRTVWTIKPFGYGRVFFPPTYSTLTLALLKMGDLVQVTGLLPWRPNMIPNTLNLLLPLYNDIVYPSTTF